MSQSEPDNLQEDFASIWEQLRLYKHYLQQYLERIVTRDYPRDWHFAHIPRFEQIYQARYVSNLDNTEESPERLPQVLLRGKPVLLVGGSGLGKTFELCNLLNLWLRPDISTRRYSWQKAIPLLLDMSVKSVYTALAESDTWDECVTQVVARLSNSVICPTSGDRKELGYALKEQISPRKGALWIIDNFDRVPDDYLDGCLRWLELVTQEHDLFRTYEVFVVMTCRPSLWNTYETRLDSMAAWSRAELSVLTRDDLVNMYKKWYGLKGIPPDLDQRAKTFVARLYRRQSLQRAARVPVVAKHSILWDIGPGDYHDRPLPEVRSLLYNHFWDAALRQMKFERSDLARAQSIVREVLPKLSYDSYERRAESLSEGDVRAAFGELTSQGDQGLDPIDLMHKFCDASFWLEYRGGEFCFIHEAFREFLASLYFASLDLSPQLFEALRRVSQQLGDYGEIVLLALSYIAYHNPGRRTVVTSPVKERHIVAILLLIVTLYPQILTNAEALRWLAEVLVDTNLLSSELAP